MTRTHSNDGDAISYTAYLEICDRFDLEPVAPDYYTFLLQVCVIGFQAIPYQKGQEIQVYDMNTGVHHPINSDDIKSLDAAQLENLAALTKKLQK